MLLLALAALASGKRRYDDYSVFGVKGADAALMDQLQQEFDVWGIGRDGSVHVFAQKPAFGDLIASQKNNSGVSFMLLQESIQALLDEEEARLRTPSKNNEWFEEYHDYNSTYQWYAELANAYPQLVRFTPSVGKTHEGRDIFSVSVTSSVGANKPQIYIQANIHAREWITNAAIQFFYYSLLTLYGTDQYVTQALDTTEILIIPIVNPDGYSFSWTNDRLWRKNRLYSSPGVYGVDLNRNWNDHWGGAGSSGNPSSDTYRGPSVESEPETKALVNFFLNAGRVVAAVDIHSYSQFILRPYTWTRTLAPNDALLKELGDEMRDLIFSVHQKQYTSGTWFSTLYESTGVAQDWWHNDIPSSVSGFRAYAYTIELRPTTSVPGFILPPEEIIPQGEELLPALLHLAINAAQAPIPF
eukprot:TRINITY_DN1702_c0_g1_i1.p1 TRINITY_DN1702_c0_g1~~TRINITY_DN1702_c0_g1_i1.p1  ORF type:complete len:425 (-),score=118.92 TRINITY_DN1702_c0_g1_i1:44-1285(-)